MVDSPGDPFPASGDELIPVRMVAQYVYCPRLFYLMYVEGRWEDNEYTVEGRALHRRVDGREDSLPDPVDESPADSEGDSPPTISRSVSLASEELGITGKLDLVVTGRSAAIPVETKRGRVPDNPERSWEADRVQLMAQALLLRRHGYACDRGILYYSGSRTRVEVPLDDALRDATLAAVTGARSLLDTRIPPAPLEDSPKCNGCSLAGICLPDETLALEHVRPDSTTKPRRLYPVRDDAVPLYVQEQGSIIGKDRGSLVVRFRGEELARIRLKDISQLVLLGNVMVTAPAVHLLCRSSIPIVHLSKGHWFYGVTHGITLRNAFARAAQFESAADPARCLELARAVVVAKGQNQRTLLRRNGEPGRAREALRAMRELLRRVPGVSTPDDLLGLEGALAAAYFRSFAAMLKSRSVETTWDFRRRNRRPPKDPINACSRSPTQSSSRSAPWPFSPKASTPTGASTIDLGTASRAWPSISWRSSAPWSPIARSSRPSTRAC